MVELHLVMAGPIAAKHLGLAEMEQAGCRIGQLVNMFS